MSRQISELENILTLMITEHRNMLGFLETQQNAMKHCDLKVMDEMAVVQEACRLRLASLEARRRNIVMQIARDFRLSGDVTLRKLAAVCPPRSAALLALRTELKTVTEKLRAQAFVSGRVANAVLGHLNTVVRLVAGAVEKAGLYNKRGVPRVSNRIGVMEAVG